MNAWRKGRQFIILLEKRKFSYQLQITEIENQLLRIDFLLDEKVKEYESVNQAISFLTPSGVLDRSSIYLSIMRQGVLLSRRQLIVHEISQIEDKKIEINLKLQEFRTASNLLEKRFHKVTRDLTQRYYHYCRRNRNNDENETQEIICNVRKKL